jgi:hypothetical protein
MRALITSIAVAATIFSGPVSAQSQAKEDLKTDQSVPKSGSAGGQTAPDQNAKQEGSSKSTDGVAVDSAIFVDGRLTVPGATDGETVPSKFSARTFADDQVPIAAYATRYLSKQELETIRSTLMTNASAVGSRALNGFAQIGAIVPTAVALEGMPFVPADLVRQIPSLTATAYLISENKLLLVNPRTRIVIGVIE